MLSRAASSIYWMHRYLERAESLARLVEATLHFSLDLASVAGDAWEDLVASTGDLEPYVARFGQPNRENVVAFLVFDGENPDSVLSSVRAARENARTVREHLPGEAWEQVNGLHLYLKEQAAQGPVDAVLARVRAAGRQIEGTLEAGASRDEAWSFGQLGRQCERADQTSRLVDAHHALLPPHAEPPGAAARWEGVLKSAGALQMYRRVHAATDGQRAAGFLLLDLAFPQSLAFCLHWAEAALRAINGTPAGQFRNAAEKALGRLAAELRYTEMADILQAGLSPWLDRFQARLNAVGEEVRLAYFEAPSSPRGEAQAQQ